MDGEEDVDLWFNSSYPRHFNGTGLYICSLCPSPRNLTFTLLKTHRHTHTRMCTHWDKPAVWFTHTHSQGSIVDTGQAVEIDLFWGRYLYPCEPGGRHGGGVKLFFVYAWDTFTKLISTHTAQALFNMSKLKCLWWYNQSTVNRAGWRSRQFWLCVCGI